MGKATKKELLNAQQLAKSGVLCAPQDFIDASIDKLIEFCNGCGADNSDFRPPKRIYGTLIVYACIIHDWGYSFGISNEDKEREDRTFLNNMLRLIKRDSHKWWKPTKLQRIRAQGYYLSVLYFGGPAFWNGK